jgi:outer membrane lipoprotein-sorting protein
MRGVSLSAALLFCLAASAADLESLKPQVSYSAVRTISAGGQKMQGRYYYAPDKHRNEMNLGGETMTSIVREDLGVIWNLMPSHDMYMEVSAADSTVPGGISGPDTAELVDYEVLGSETVNGYLTTKHRVTTRDPAGESVSGFLWATDDMIPVRMEMTTGSGEGMVMNVSDIEVGDHPPALFEVPSGYRKFSIGAGASARPALAGHESNDMPGSGPGFTDEMLEVAGEAAKEGAKEGVGEEVREQVTKGLRKLFGR